MKSDHYHFIIAGAGASGLSLLIHLINSGNFTDHKILLVDKAPKTANDRTWCFWEQEAGVFESIVYKRWNKLWFHSRDKHSSIHDIAPYEYKMIRGIDFYRYCFDIINQQKNVTVEYGDAENLQSSDAGASLAINGRTVHADYIFNSIPPSFSTFRNDEYFLWQHFKGWFIKTSGPTFDAHEATLMDFRVDQQHDTRFVYVMPFTATEALVEYTVLSKTRLNDDEYHEALRAYCSKILRLDATGYQVLSEEFGMIPMINATFPQSHGRIIFLGGAGGQTKASSGYTFRNIQKHSAGIVNALIRNGRPLVEMPAKKFHFYDSILLKILTEGSVQGADIFANLFQNNRMTAVMKFLDNETSLKEDIKLIRKLPTAKFMGAAITHLLK